MPSYEFINECIKIAKAKKYADKYSSDTYAFQPQISLIFKMKFIDNLGKIYEVDVISLYDKYQNSGNQITKEDDLLKFVHSNLLNKKNSIAVNPKMFRQSNDLRNLDVENEIFGKQTKNMKKIDNKLLFHVENETRDCHLMEIFDQMGFDWSKDLHFIETIEEFVRQKSYQYKENNWQSRQNSEGKLYWTNIKTKVSTTKYPYKQELAKQISTKKDEIKNIQLDSKKYKKKHYKIQKMIICSKLIKKIPEIRSQTLKLLATTVKLPGLVKQDYNLNTKLKTYIQHELELLKSKLIENQEEYENSSNCSDTSISEEIFSIEDFLYLVFECDFNINHYIREKLQSNEENEELQKIFDHVQGDQNLESYGLEPNPLGAMALFKHNLFDKRQSVRRSKVLRDESKICTGLPNKTSYEKSESVEKIDPNDDQEPSKMSLTQNNNENLSKEQIDSHPESNFNKLNILIESQLSVLLSVEDIQDLVKNKFTNSHRNITKTYMRDVDDGVKNIVKSVLLELQLEVEPTKQMINILKNILIKKGGKFSQGLSMLYSISPHSTETNHKVKEILSLIDEEKMDLQNDKVFFEACKSCIKRLHDSETIYIKRLHRAETNRAINKDQSRSSADFSLLTISNSSKNSDQKTMLDLGQLTTKQKHSLNPLKPTKQISLTNLNKEPEKTDCLIQLNKKTINENLLSKKRNPVKSFLSKDISKLLKKNDSKKTMEDNKNLLRNIIQHRKNCNEFEKLMSDIKNDDYKKTKVKKANSLYQRRDSFYLNYFDFEDKNFIKSIKQKFIGKKVFQKSCKDIQTRKETGSQNSHVPDTYMEAYKKSMRKIESFTELPFDKKVNQKA